MVKIIIQLLLLIKNKNNNNNNKQFIYFKWIHKLFYFIEILKA